MFQEENLLCLPAFGSYNHTEMIRSKTSHISKTTLPRNRRIGRKVLAADRLAHALNTSTEKKTRKDWRKTFLRSKLVVTALVCVVAFSILGWIASQAYFAQQISVQKAEDLRLAGERKAKAAKADACRRAKLEQKVDLIGKITYDELYDYGECDK
jgi:hypothetical protein